MITLTPTAIKAVQRFVQTSADPVAGLRILVSGGGCSGLQYGMRIESARQDDDVVVECEGLTLLVDPLSAPLLEGLKIDFVDSLSGSGFKFQNPQASHACGCGQSFSA
jgi:iron-sulfur cluster assembly protein